MTEQQIREAVIKDVISIPRTISEATVRRFNLLNIVKKNDDECGN